MGSLPVNNRSFGQLSRTRPGLSLVELLIAIAALRLLGALVVAGADHVRLECMPRLTPGQTVTQVTRPRLALQTVATSNPVHLYRTQAIHAVVTNQGNTAVTL